MSSEQQLIDEAQRLRTVDGFKEGVALIEMESRTFRRRRLPYVSTMDQLALIKADAIVAAEGCGNRMGLMPVEISRLIRLLADEFIKECRDGG